MQRLQIVILIPVSVQTRFRFLKTGFKPVFGFTDLHRNSNLVVSYTIFKLS